MGLLRPLSSIESVEIAEIDRAKTTPEWRNWQTRQLEGLVRLQAGAGSSPVVGTKRPDRRIETFQNGSQHQLNSIWTEFMMMPLNFQYNPVPLNSGMPSILQREFPEEL